MQSQCHIKQLLFVQLLVFPNVGFQHIKEFADLLFVNRFFILVLKDIANISENLLNILT